MIKEIDIIKLLNACSAAQAIANKTGETQTIKINDFEIKEGAKK